MMTIQMTDRRKRYLTYVGCFCVLFPVAVPWYWGNLSDYTNSYFRATFGPDSGFETPWIIPLYLCMMTVGVFVSNSTYKIIGNRWTCLAAALIFNTTMFLNYYLVQISFYPIIVTIGVVCGFCHGITNGAVLLAVHEWTPREKLATFTGIVLTSINAGPLFINQIITLYTNPRNLSPDLIDKGEVYFTRAEILNRVPSAFLVIGGTSAGLQLLGVLLMRTKTEDGACNKESRPGTVSEGTGFHKSEQRYVVYSEDNSSTMETCCLNSGQPSTGESIQSHRYNQEIVNRPCPDDGLDLVKFGSENNSNSIEEKPIDCSSRGPSTTHTEMNNTGNTGTKQNDGNNPDKNWTTLQMLKSSYFFVLWFGYLSADFNLFIVSAYYKIFGQLMIRDDHFLTDISMITLIVSVMSRISLGFLIDGLEFKYTFLIQSSILAIGSTFWYFTPMVSKWLYMLWTTIYGSVVSTLYVFYPLATLKLFGLTHYTYNYGAVMSAAAVVSIVGPPCVDVILDGGNWFILFLSCGVLHLLSLVLFLILLPKF